MFADYQVARNKFPGNPLSRHDFRRYVPEYLQLWCVLLALAWNFPSSWRWQLNNRRWSEWPRAGNNPPQVQNCLLSGLSAQPFARPGGAFHSTPRSTRRPFLRRYPKTMAAGFQVIGKDCETGQVLGRIESS